MNKEDGRRRECDVLVLGSGAAGLATAVTAAKHGLNVSILEKENVFGGTTAFSGGVLWIPGNALAYARGIVDERDSARAYLRHEIGNFYDVDSVEAYLENGPKMLDFFESETEVQFLPTDYPDYHPDAPGGVDIGRSVVAAPYDIRKLGTEVARLRRPLEAITFMGMMFNSTNRELRHFFNVTKSARSAAYVAKRLGQHIIALLRYGRGVEVTGGNALVARLVRTALNEGVPIITGARTRELIVEEGRVTGARVDVDGSEVTFSARLGVVLACGGFSHAAAKTRSAFPHLSQGGEHLSLTPESNTGDGIGFAESAGARFQSRLSQAAAWMPASSIPGHGPYPHIVDRYKPGVIAVNNKGLRFTNEANSYHDFCSAMLRECGPRPEAWLICDHRTIRKYGLGFVKPAPVPLGHHLRSGYLKKAPSISKLAEWIGVDVDALEATIGRYNNDARRGEDSVFGRGRTSFNRFLGDREHQPNPNVAPVEAPPYYAIRVVMGDIGTFDGIATDTVGRVLGSNDTPIGGLFAVGNDRRSIMGGNYPGAGITLGPAMTFGYVTALHLASQSDLDARSEDLAS